MRHWVKMAIAGAALAVGSSANALTVKVVNDTNINAYSATVRGSVICNSCSVLRYDPLSYSLSTTQGELFAGPSSSGDANEASWINLVLGTTFTKANVTAGKVSTGIADAFTYATNSLYVAIKIGKNPDYTIIKNTSGGTLNWSWNPTKGTGAGLSHFVALGTPPSPPPSAVPLPATGLILVAALGSIAAFRRRKA